MDPTLAPLMVDQVRGLFGPLAVYILAVLFLLKHLGVFARLRGKNRIGQPNNPGQAQVCVERGEALAVLKVTIEDTRERLVRIEKKLDKMNSGAK